MFQFYLFWSYKIFEKKSSVGNILERRRKAIEGNNQREHTKFFFYLPFSLQFFSKILKMLENFLQKVKWFHNNTKTISISATGVALL